MKVIYTAIRGEMEKEFNRLSKPIAKAATATIREAARLVKKEFKTEFSGAGFSARTANAGRASIKPKTGDSINCSATFFLKPAYLSVFEKGATIHGKPLLWLPLDGVPIGDRGRQLSPKQYIQRIGPLHSSRRGSSKPLLFGKGTGATIRRATSKAVSFRKNKTTRAGQFRGAVNVPLFVGVPFVKIPKRVNLAGIVKRAGDNIGKLYLKNIQKDANKNG